MKRDETGFRADTLIQRWKWGSRFGQRALLNRRRWPLRGLADPLAVTREIAVGIDERPLDAMPQLLDRQGWIVQVSGGHRPMLQGEV